jgi:hypothetical protein
VLQRAGTDADCGTTLQALHAITSKYESSAKHLTFIYSTPTEESPEWYTSKAKGNRSIAATTLGDLAAATTTPTTTTTTAAGKRKREGTCDCGGGDGFQHTTRHTWHGCLHHRDKAAKPRVAAAKPATQPAAATAGGAAAPTAPPSSTSDLESLVRQLCSDVAEMKRSMRGDDGSDPESDEEDD